MSRKYTQEEKALLIERYRSGEPVKCILENSNIPKSTFYGWLKDDAQQTASDNEIPLTRKNFCALRKRASRLEEIIDVLQNARCTPQAPLSEKLPELERLYGQHSVHIICEALNVPRGTFYNYIFRNKRENNVYAKQREVLREKIQEIYHDSHQIYGAAKIEAVLRQQGVHTSVKTVRELMGEMGLISIRGDAKKLYEKYEKGFPNHVNQQFDTTAPNQIWVSDVTYFRYNKKPYYICVVIDLFARKVVSYKISMRNSTQLVKATFKQAFETRNPTGDLIFHSD